MRCDRPAPTKGAIPNCFNPHTYMRCDVTKQLLNMAETVSIHTPTWGVTLVCAWKKKIYYVSIHTPTWGVTSLTRRRSPKHLEFQSTHLHEVWHVAVGNNANRWWFQSTHLHEVWLVSKSKTNILWKFQSTHLHEVWHSIFAVAADSIWVSIHTPTWGVTP